MRSHIEMSSAPNATGASSAPARLKPAQRRTLDVGSCVALSALGLGFQLGGWPAWTFLAGIVIYVAWVVLYAELTIQTTRHHQPDKEISHNRE